MKTALVVAGFVVVYWLLCGQLIIGTNVVYKGPLAKYFDG